MWSDDGKEENGIRGTHSEGHFVQGSWAWSNESFKQRQWRIEVDIFSAELKHLLFLNDLSNTAGTSSNEQAP